MEQTTKENKAIVAVEGINTVQATLTPKTETNNAQGTSEGFKERLYTFIKVGEGSFQEKAFCDSYYTKAQKIQYGIWPWKIRHPAHLCTYWSIWYGTKSYNGETIAIEEALKRKKEDVDGRLSKITSECLTDNQKIATVDFLYQHWINSSRVLANANACNTNAIFNMFVWWRDEYKDRLEWGMVKREQGRINLFYKQ